MENKRFEKIIMLHLEHTEQVYDNEIVADMLLLYQS